MATPVHAAALTVGLAVPREGSSDILGEQMRRGAAAAAQETGAQIVEADDACTAASGIAAAQNFIENEVDLVIGFACTETIEAALPALKDAGIPVITPAVRTASLTDKHERTGWPVFRIAPRGDAERGSVARILIERWRDAHFAIVDDGTIYGRELAENLRAEAEQQGLKPVYVDTFRPQLDNQIGLIGRLNRAGATHVFVGGDREDVAVMARDAAGLGYPIVFAGGEALRSAPGAVPLATGTLMIGLPEWSEIAPQDLVASFREAGIEPEGYVLPTYAAFQIADQAGTQAEESETSLAEALSSTAFQTVIGAVRFDEKGDRAENPYRLYRFDGTNFVPVE